MSRLHVPETMPCHAKIAGKCLPAGGLRKMMGAGTVLRMVVAAISGGFAWHCPWVGVSDGHCGAVA